MATAFFEVQMSSEIDEIKLRFYELIDEFRKSIQLLEERFDKLCEDPDIDDLDEIVDNLEISLRTIQND